MNAVLWQVHYYSTIDNNDGSDSCYESDIRLGNRSQVSLPYSTESYTGRVEICSNGQYVDVCNNTVEAQYIANRSCQYYYSNSGEFSWMCTISDSNYYFSLSVATIISYDMDYSSGQGSYSANNCSDIRYDGVRGCSNSTTDTSCSVNGSSPLSVRCELGE